MSVAAGLSLLVCACDEPTRDKPTDPLSEALDQAVPVELSSFCGRYLGTICNRQLDCGRFGEVPNPYDPCEEWVLAQQADCEAHWLTLPAAGMATYSPEEAGRCLTLLRVGLCGDVFDDPAFTHRCVRRAFTGAGADGDPCHADLGCQAGLVCDLSDACPGRCVAEPESPPLGLIEGAGCGGELGSCGFGLSCFGGACARPRGKGEACGEEIGGCDEFRTWCQLEGEAVAGTCVDLPTAGQECGLGQGERCAGASCDPGFGFCFTPPRAAEATCDPNTPEVCDSWSCSELRQCDPVGWPFPACPVPAPEE